MKCVSGVMRDSEKYNNFSIFERQEHIYEKNVIITE